MCDGVDVDGFGVDDGFEGFDGFGGSGCGGSGIGGSDSTHSHTALDKFQSYTYPQYL